jgi:hypothetical protein
MNYKIYVTFLLVIAINVVVGEITPRFPTSPSQPIIVPQNQNSGIISGLVLPCDLEYWRLGTFSGVEDWHYLRIEYNQTTDIDHPGDNGHMYILRSSYEDLETELANNNEIISTLGELPGPSNYDYVCDSDCTVEINCEFQDGTYYLAFGGGEFSIIEYEFQVFRGEVDVSLGPEQILSGVQQPVFEDQRATQPPVARVNNYHYYSIDVTDFSEGTYLTVSLSRASTDDLTLRLMHESLPIGSADNGVLDETEDDSLNSCVFQYCVDTNRTITDVNGLTYDGPVNTDPRIPCACRPHREAVVTSQGAGVQFICELTVDPCHFEYGTWYISIELPERDFPEDDTDVTGIVQYTVLARAIAPAISLPLARNVTYKGFVEPERTTHYKIDVPNSAVTDGESHLLVHTSNVRNGFVDIWVHQGLGQNMNLAGGPEACVPANATCRTCDACNVVIEKCHFTPGTWYISFSVAEDDSGNFMVEDVDRLPITYTFRVTWMNDSPPVPLLAGIPANRYIGEALYDFYVIEIPPTIDTWLYVELYAQAEDTEVILSMLHGALPGGECYERPDFYCLTGDPRDITINTGPPQNLVNTPVQREACSFMIQTCELEAGPLFLSVYGHHVGYNRYGDTTFYQVPVHYTLFVDFDVALSLTSGLSYSENVFEKQYQHYYIRADNIQEGSWLSVEITNIQHGVPQTLEGFINYNFLAGNCPCYDHLYNCTGSVLPSCDGVIADVEPNLIPDPDIVRLSCTMKVPACDFRSGVWYVSVLGVNENLVEYSTPIGYTLTVTVHEAPKINPLMLSQSISDTVPQWNKTMEYTHYKVAVSPIPNHNLIFQLTYAQNPEFLAKHDNLRDTLYMYVKRNGVAGSECWDWNCWANIEGHSYCSIVVPSCKFEEGDYFVAIKGDFDAVFDGRYTIETHLEEVKDTPLSSGISVYGRVDEYQYNHYFIDVAENAVTNFYLLIDLYTNSDQDMVTVYINIDERAGNSPCYENMMVCWTSSSCQWKIDPCDLVVGRYYISVYGPVHQFYDISTEYTLTASLRPITERILGADPVTGHIQVGQTYHYEFDLTSANLLGSGDFLLFEVENVKHGVVEAFVNYEAYAGRCPCYQNINSAICRADSDNADGAPNWCEIRIPVCELQDGHYYFSIVGLENKTPDPTPHTPIGYTIEVNVVSPVDADGIIEPTVVNGRFF